MRIFSMCFRRSRNREESMTLLRQSTSIQAELYYDDDEEKEEKKEAYPTAEHKIIIRDQADLRDLSTLEQLDILDDKSQRPALLRLAYMGRLPSQQGYCMTWALKDLAMLLVSMGMITGMGALGCYLRTVYTRGDISLYNYNHEILLNNQTCSETFENYTSTSRICNGQSGDYPPDEINLFSICRDILDDYCKSIIDGTFLFMPTAGVLLIFFMLRYCRFRHTSAQDSLSEYYEEVREKLISTYTIHSTDEEKSISTHKAKQAARIGSFLEEDFPSRRFEPKILGVVADYLHEPAPAAPSSP